MTMIHMRGVHGLHVQYFPTSDPEVYPIVVLGSRDLEGDDTTVPAGPTAPAAWCGALWCGVHVVPVLAVQ